MKGKKKMDHSEEPDVLLLLDESFQMNAFTQSFQNNYTVLGFH